MLSRWKLMAGILGVSLGGLAAAASQCPKFDRSKGRSEEAPAAKAEPKLPPAGAPSAPPTPPKLEIPAPPQLTPGGSTPPVTLDLPKLPDAPPAPTGLPPIPQKSEPATPVIPTAGTAPAKPESKPAEPALPPVDAGKKPVPPTTAAPADPLIGDLVPTPPMGKPSAPAPLMEGKNDVKPMKSASGPPSATLNTVPVVPNGVTNHPPEVSGIGTGGIPMPATIADTVPPLPGGTEASPVVTGPAIVYPDANVSKPAPAGVQAGATPYRILLRVGEGEPTFEVKNGDNLVLKVACDKVDIKSPEKGAGLSEVTARGKVRFAGFGAEGTCDELKFFAGTGEVSMTGTVKVQVKDKLGRVESELTTGSMKYKIDASAVGGQIKP